MLQCAQPGVARAISFLQGGCNATPVRTLLIPAAPGAMGSGVSAYLARFATNSSLAMPAILRVNLISSPDTFPLIVKKTRPAQPVRRLMEAWEFQVFN